MEIEFERLQVLIGRLHHLRRIVIQGSPATRLNENVDF